LVTAGFVRLRISDRVVAALTLAYAGFYPLDYAWVSREFLRATVHLVLFLAIVKILTAKTNRDYFFVKVIAFLEMLVASALSTSPNYFLFLALFLVFGVATFASSEIRSSAQRPGTVCRAGLRDFQFRLAALSVLIALVVLLLTGGLFFLLPRTARAAFQRLAASGYVTPGFSNEIQLGRFGEFREQSAPVMHVRVEGVAGQTNFKWRGGALGEFDGKRWYNSRGGAKILRATQGFVWLVDSRAIWRPGRRIAYDVFLRSISSDALFFAGVPQYVRLTGDGVVRSRTGAFRATLGTDNIRYYAESYVSAERQALPEPEGLSSELRVYYRLLPPFDPRVLELARALTAGQATDEERAWAMEDHLRRNYGYTTEMLGSEVADPLANFLFVRRKGHCEYFASAMAVMLRAVNIPARVATGFQSGVYNPVSGWHIVRASDAHSWVEAYVDGRGWMTFDPTPPAAFQARPSLWARALFYADAAETFWQEWVLNYDLNRQLTLAARMEQSSRKLSLNWLDAFGARFVGLRDLGIKTARRLAVPAVCIIFLAILAWRFGPAVLRWWRTRQRVESVRRGQARQTDATLLYERMLRVLHKRGIEKPPSQTPAEFARLHDLPELAGFTAAYNQLRFGNRLAAAETMVELLARVESS
jgi:transglutaminase-like putative cysteine protease